MFLEVELAGPALTTPRAGVTGLQVTAASMGLAHVLLHGRPDLELKLQRLQENGFGIVLTMVENMQLGASQLKTPLSS